MNKNQKIVIAIALFVIAVAFIIWIKSGTYVFTQTQVLIEKKDPLFGSSYKVWQNKFIWGLDLTLIISAFSIVSSAILIFLFKDKRKTNNEIN
jgi:cbb3-type cytochrome oxidase subunit 3